MKVNFDTRKPNLGYHQLKDGTVVPFKPEYPGDQPPAGAMEVCTADGREWHPLDWYVERMTPVVRDNTNTRESISMQDQLNLYLVSAAVYKVPLLAKED